MRSRVVSAAAAAVLAGVVGVTAATRPAPKRHIPHGLCFKRPEGAPVESCLMRTPDGGTRDQGDENVMLPDLAVGPGCVATMCRVMQGQKP